MSEEYADLPLLLATLRERSARLRANWAGLTFQDAPASGSGWGNLTIIKTGW